MNIEKERELFERSGIVTTYKDHMQSFIFNGEIYQYSNNTVGLSVPQMACLGLSLTVVNSMWNGWLASRNREGYVLVPIEPTRNMEIAGMVAGAGFVSRGVYKAMIGVCDE